MRACALACACVCVHGRACKCACVHARAHARVCVRCSDRPQPSWACACVQERLSARRPCGARRRDDGTRRRRHARCFRWQCGARPSRAEPSRARRRRRCCSAVVTHQPQQAHPVRALVHVQERADAVPRPCGQHGPAASACGPVRRHHHAAGRSAGAARSRRAPPGAHSAALRGFSLFCLRRAGWGLGRAFGLLGVGRCEPTVPVVEPGLPERHARDGVELVARRARGEDRRVDGDVRAQHVRPAPPLLRRPPATLAGSGPPVADRRRCGCARAAHGAGRLSPSRSSVPPPPARIYIYMNIYIYTRCRAAGCRRGGAGAVGLSCPSIGGRGAAAQMRTCSVGSPRCTVRVTSVVPSTYCAPESTRYLRVCRDAHLEPPALGRPPARPPARTRTPPPTALGRPPASQLALAILQRPQRCAVRPQSSGGGPRDRCAPHGGRARSAAAGPKRAHAQATRAGKRAAHVVPVERRRSRSARLVVDDRGIRAHLHTHGMVSHTARYPTRHEPADRGHMAVSPSTYARTQHAPRARARAQTAACTLARSRETRSRGAHSGRGGSARECDGGWE